MTDANLKCTVKKYLLNELEYKLESSELVFFRKDLLDWYKLNRRLLPWRGDPMPKNLLNTPSSSIDPYGVWISEVMCQQTRVETVIDYWLKWMQRFPTIEVLSQASEEEVNQYWAGLGYYRRAQQLLLGAKKVINEFNGQLPQTTTQLLTIPGIGPYTAGAVASIAFGVVAPLVDGNVIRVFSRLFAIDVEVEVGTKKNRKNLLVDSRKRYRYERSRRFQPSVDGSWCNNLQAYDVKHVH
jgi:A/G-specific adenine glycosylase